MTELHRAFCRYDSLLLAGAIATVTCTSTNGSSLHSLDFARVRLSARITGTTDICIATPVEVSSPAVTYTCCMTGTSYAMSNATYVTMVSGSLQSYPSRRCFRDTTSLPALTCIKQRNNWGWYNRGPTRGMFVDLVAGAGNGNGGTVSTTCGGGTRVGSVRMACNATNPKLVTLTIRNHARSVLTSQHFFVGCRGPSDCGPSDFGATNATCSTTSSYYACGGNFNKASSTLSAPQAVPGNPLESEQTLTVMMKGTCSCQDAFWVIHQSASEGSNGVYKGDWCGLSRP